MESAFSFPGAYTDRHGTELITWRVSPSVRRQPPGVMGYEIETTIRASHFCGYEFDDLQPRDADQATAAGMPLSGLSGELADSVITGDLPCTVEVDGQRVPSVVTIPTRRAMTPTVGGKFAAATGKDQESEKVHTLRS